MTPIRNALFMVILDVLKTLLLRFLLFLYGAPLYLCSFCAFCVFHITVPSERHPGKNHPLAFRKKDHSQPKLQYRDNQAYARECIKHNVSTLWMRDMGHTDIPQNETTAHKSKL